MEVKFQIFEKEKLLIQKFIGSFAFNSYVHYSKYLVQNFNLNPVNKVIIDFRQLQFDKDLIEVKHEVGKMANFQKNEIPEHIKNKKVKRLFWVDTPLPTVIAHMFISQFPNEESSFCSSLENALLFLNYKKNEIDLESMIDNLDHSYSPPV